MTAKRKPWTKRPDAPPRLSGRAGQERRRRWLGSHPLCARCGAVATVPDHILMLTKGGADNESNFQSLCKTCHDRKSAEEMGRKAKSIIGIDGYPVKK